MSTTFFLIELERFKFVYVSTCGSLSAVRSVYFLQASFKKIDFKSFKLLNKVTWVKSASNIKNDCLSRFQPTVNTKNCRPTIS